MPVYYKCKICAGEHSAPILLRDEESFDRVNLQDNSLQCPEKRESAIYEKEDMFWKDE